MSKKVLIVEDLFVEANDLRLMLERAGYRVTGIARSVQKAQELTGKEKPDLVLVDIFLQGKLTGIDLARWLKEQDIAFIYLSANSNADILAAAKTTEPYGFLVKPFRERDVLIALEIARYRHEHSLETQLRKEVRLLRQLEEQPAGNTSWEEKLLHLGKALQSCVPFDLLSAPDILLRRIGFDEYQLLGTRELMTVTGLKQEEVTNIQQVATTFQMKSHFVLPLQLADDQPFCLNFFSKRLDAYNAVHTTLTGRLQQPLTRVINALRPGSPLTKQHFKPQVSPVSVFEGIIGNSHLLLNVFDLVTQVAASDTSVLVLGESGTGKEKISACIHRLSPRRDKPFVKVNCAALPASLIESALFGHEKGAFTGATDKRIGKFEQANGGTIFLDEIGEMPVELQAKLLRVLQEKEIERIGARTTTKVNVRIIAATNRDLEKEVAAGRFRLDLYYRLNVFPVELPALQERKEDIPALTEHFIHHYNTKTGKNITGVSFHVMKALQSYHWPGNVRELENMIERAMLLEKTSVIETLDLPATQAIQPTATVKTMQENERDHIMTVLSKCNGKIWGPGGAAELLNMPPTTLTSRMKKLGISKKYIE